VSNISLIVFRLVSEVDLKVFVFDKFGKNFPKSQKVSPDSFIQNAIQLAYYRYRVHWLMFTKALM